MSESFLDLIDAARRGEGPALDLLLQRHLPDVGALVRLQAGKSLRTRESWSDLVQTVCRELLTDLRQFRGNSEGEFRGWLGSLVLRKMLEKKRFHLAARRDLRREENGFDCEATLCAAYSRLAPPSEQAELREQVERFERAFDLLPDDYREALLGAYFLDHSSAELATRMDRTEEAVRQLLVRARARLAMLLAGETS